MAGQRHTRAGTGYLVAPPGGGGGPGILVLHAWWGLTPFFRDVCDRLANEGFVALAPDLHGGRTADTPDEAEALLAGMDANRAADLVLSSAATLRDLPITPDGPIGVLGFSMGASLAYWAAARAPDHVAAVSGFYGAQNVDFVRAKAAFQGHFAEHDEFVTENERIEMEGDLLLVEKDVEFHDYPGTAHWFFEADRVPAYDESAAELAWSRTVAFFRRHLG